MPRHVLRIRRAIFATLCAVTVTTSGASASAKEPRWTFRVRGQTTLGEVSLRLYGTTHRWREIARSSHLHAPYWLHEGQSLTLERKPTLDEREGENKVLEMWRARFDTQAGESPSLASKEPVSTKSAPAPAAKEAAERSAYLSSLETERKADGEDAASPELSAEQLKAEGQALLNQGKFEQAAAKLRKSRELDPAPLSPWLLELSALRSLGRLDDARETARQLVREHSEVRALPAVSQLLEERQ